MKEKQDKPKSAWSYWPPADQLIGVWAVLVMAVSSIAVSGIPSLVSRLSMAQWFCCYSVALVAAILGAGLIFFAKLPLYRQHRFYTFGSGTISEGRRQHYRWGYRCFGLATVAAVVLLLGRMCAPSL